MSAPASTSTVQGLDAFLETLRLRRPSCVVCSPATTTQEHFYAVALFPQNEHDPVDPVWFSASSLSGVSVTDDFDVAAHLRSFYKEFSQLYTLYGAVNACETRDACSVEASVGDRRATATCGVHFLSMGMVVCFQMKWLIRQPTAVLLQRTLCAGTRTFDAVVFYKKNQTETETFKEFRLVPKMSLTDVESWGLASRCVVFSSPDIPVDPKLILSARHQGEDWTNIARALTGDDESSEEDSEWQKSGSEWEECDDLDTSDSESDCDLSQEDVKYMLS